ncbi:hypothetical protein ABFS83_06G195800 [Erythranthe nasuta]
MNPRAAKALSAMGKLGISPETVKPVLKNLFKLYNRNWELIEDDNYRTLADAIFEVQEEKLTAEKKEVRINEGSGASFKKPPSGGVPEDQVSSTTSGVQKGSSGTRIVESSSASANPTNEPRCFATDEAPSGSKRKKPVQENRFADEGNSSAQPKRRALRLVDESDDSDEGNRKAIVLWEKQPEENSPIFAIPTSPIPKASEKASYKIKKNDITNGTEKIKISLVGQTSSNEDLPRFVYSPENTIYESAYLHISLARIADDDCCSDCIGDCVSSSIPCACARDTGGEFAYTQDGLLCEKFLDACISMKVSEEKHYKFYCQDCPFERAKSAHMPEKCKGHLSRKFIKECWRKCGCNMQCANRVVQRGITRKLQVFLTGNDKGWGLRALEELPKGAFVCEYIGEILTNIELYERNQKNIGRDKHVYPVLLDADWATEGVLKDEEALCLDATYFGNVARFINHRCFDGNLLDIPVQVETPDRHYYHVAFFTKRKVEALEELTWDYLIDFNDESHPVEAFECRCGSKYCRDVKGKRKV